MQMTRLAIPAFFALTYAMLVYQALRLTGEF